MTVITTFSLTLELPDKPAVRKAVEKICAQIHAEFNDRVNDSFLDPVTVIFGKATELELEPKFRELDISICTRESKNGSPGGTRP